MALSVSLLKKYRTQVLFKIGALTEEDTHSALVADFQQVYSIVTDNTIPVTCGACHRIKILYGKAVEHMRQCLPHIKCPITFLVSSLNVDILTQIAYRRNKGDIIILEHVDTFGGPCMALQQVKDFIVNNMDVRYEFVHLEAPQNMVIAATPKGGEDYLYARSWSSDQLDFLHSIISTEALAMLLLERLDMNSSASVIRMADGERAIIECADPQHPIGSFLADPDWIRAYGLVGCDLRVLGRDLLQAGKDADFLAVPISGLYLENFEMASMFPGRKYIDQFYPRFLLATGRIREILREGRTIVLHHDAYRIARALEAKHKLAPMDFFPLSNCDQHEQAMNAVADSQCKIVLLSGGPSSKPLAVRMARQLNKIVLDVGSEMSYTWTTNQVF